VGHVARGDRWPQGHQGREPGGRGASVRTRQKRLWRAEQRVGPRAAHQSPAEPHRRPGPS